MTGNSRNGAKYLHRLIAEASGHNLDGFEVDHINRDELDNRRENLRVATRSQNGANRSPVNGKTYKGTHLHYGGKFQARGKLNGKQVYLGTFGTEIEAARAYDAWAIIHHGEFAYLNFEVAA